MSRFDAAIAEQIWDMKYRLKDADETAMINQLRTHGQELQKTLQVLRRIKCIGKKSSMQP